MEIHSEIVCWSDLSLKECKVLELAAQGIPRKAISDHPDIQLGEHTINKMLSNEASSRSIYRKLGVQTFQEAIAWYYRARTTPTISDPKAHFNPAQISSLPSTNGAKWFYTAEEILEFEERINTAEIWIVSPHLLNDTGTQFETDPEGASTIDAAIANLKRQIDYTFIVPDTNKIRAALHQLRQNYQGHAGSVHSIVIPPDIFESLTISELAIYNPRMENRRPRRVFMELPICIPHAFWIEVAEDIAYEIVARVNKVIEKH